MAEKMRGGGEGLRRDGACKREELEGKKEERKVLSIAKIEVGEEREEEKRYI